MTAFATLICHCNGLSKGPEERANTQQHIQNCPFHHAKIHNAQIIITIQNHRNYAKIQMHRLSQLYETLGL